MTFMNERLERKFRKFAHNLDDKYVQAARTTCFGRAPKSVGGDQNDCPHSNVGG